MTKTIVKFKDSEFGNDLVEFSYDGRKYDYTKTMNLAMKVLYLDFSYSSYEELKEDCPELTKELYDICMEVLDEGNFGVITERFCDFMKAAFGWEYKFIEGNSVIDVEYGKWDYE